MEEGNVTNNLQKKPFSRYKGRMENWLWGISQDLFFITNGTNTEAYS